MNPEQFQEFEQLKREVEDLKYILSKKTGLGSADIKNNLISGTIGADSVSTASLQNNSVTNIKVADDTIKQAELDTEFVAVTVSAGNPSGTGVCTSGSVIIGWRATGNQDQFIDNIAVSGTTVTVTLAGNATADNTFSVTLLKV